MKGIILCAGNGTRIQPIAGPKPLVQLYQTPMIYHQITAMIEANVKDILIIISPDSDKYYTCIGTGHQWGVNILYATQMEPIGTADAFNVASAAKFITDEPTILAYGDNIFLGEKFIETLAALPETYEEGKALNFCLEVEKPNAFGVYQFSEDGKTVTDIIEKPKVGAEPSRYASVGFYVFPSDIVEKVKTLKHSSRGELELPDAMQQYIKEKKFQAIKLDSSVSWHDAGNADAALDVANKLSELFEEGFMYGSPEIAALKKGFLKPQVLIDNYTKDPGNHKSVYYQKVLDFAKDRQAQQQATAASSSSSTLANGFFLPTSNAGKRKLGCS